MRLKCWSFAHSLEARPGRIGVRAAGYISIVRLCRWAKSTTHRPHWNPRGIYLLCNSRRALQQKRDKPQPGSLV